MSADTAASPEAAENIAGEIFALREPAGRIDAYGTCRQWDDPAHAAMDASSQGLTVLGALPFRSDHPSALVAPVRLETIAYPPLTRTAPLVPSISAVTECPDRDTHRERVARAVAVISADDELRKVVLARAVTVEFGSAVQPSALLGRLLYQNSTATGYLVDLSAAGPGFAGATLIGATPELLIAKRGNTIESYPLAGTAARSADPVRDGQARDRLLDSIKDHDEHRYVVEAIQSVLSGYCEELTVPERPGITRTPVTWHLGTRIIGTLSSPEVTALDLATALHPTPAVCGTPTSRAAAVIDELENDRGFYAGTVGYSNQDGDGSWWVSIRGGVLDAARTHLVAHAGGGIVAASDPAAELAETDHKFRTILRACGINEEGR